LLDKSIIVATKVPSNEHELQQDSPPEAHR
jgi:hypothetical protein